MAKVEVTMPKMGESITEGTVITWHKKPGDRIELDETLLEIGTDKVDTEVPSPAEGVLGEILVPEGETVDVGTPLAVIDTEGDGEEAETAEDDSGAEAMGDGETNLYGEEVAEEEEEEPVEDEEPVAEEEGVAEEEPHLDVRPAGDGVVEVVMPKMGESITEGTVLAWHKKAGDPVELDETLLEIGTDKVDTEVPSPAAGVVKEILVKENETVEVGTPLALIATETEAPQASPKPAARKPEAQSKPSPMKETREDARAPEAPSGDGAAVEHIAEGAGDLKRKGSDGRFYSPLVRSIATKEGLSMEELESIGGSGREGRVTKADVLGYVESRKQDRGGAAPRKAPVPSEPVEGEDQEGRVEVIKMDRMRQIIAEHMVRSKATSAHVTSFAEADVTHLVRLREANKESFQRREGVKLTYTPFFVQAAVEALREHPILNASVEGDKILIRKDLHIGIAVAIGKTGLLAPVVRNAGQKSLSGLAHAAADLANRARNKQLQPDELSGGTFTITNIGSLGSLMGTPIINQPQVAILAIGAIKKRPVVLEDPELGDVIAIRHMVYLSLSYDHRIIDGAMGASFLRRFVQVVESIDVNEEI